MTEGKDKRLSRKVRRSYTISTISIALVLFMLGVVSYVTFTALTAARDLQTGVVVSVEVADDLTEEQSAAIMEGIEATAMSIDVRYMTKDEKFEDESFREQFEVDLDLLLGENPLRDSYEVTIGEKHADGASLDSFVAAVEAIEGVEYIAVPPVDVVENMHSTLSYVTIGLVVFLVVLLILSLLLLNNTIRLAIYSKRYLINTMKLVGATKWYIMRPLLISALKQGIIAGVVAAVMVVGVVYGVKSYTPEGLMLLDYKEVGIIAGALLAVGILITVLFSAFAVNKFVNMKSNKIYLY
jgi:cell division transport system permease protein